MVVGMLLCTQAFRPPAVSGAACGTGNPVTCAIGALYSVITFFFGAYFFQDRAASGALANPYFALPPTPSKTVRQRLETELAPGTWHAIGHMHDQGLNHTMEYMNDGTFHTIRAR